MVSVATTICDEALWRSLKDSTRGHIVTIDEKEFKEHQAIFNYNATIRAGVETRCTHLFSGGVEFLYKGKKMPQGDSSRWMVCGKQFLTAYVRDGIVLTTVGSGSRFPEVLDPQLYHIEVFFGYDGWRAYYVVPRGHLSASRTQGKSESKKRKRLSPTVSGAATMSGGAQNIQVTVFEGYPPLTSGKLNPPIKVLSPDESLVRTLQHCWIVAELHRSQPKVFSTSIDPSPVQRGINREYNVQGEADALAVRERNETEELALQAFDNYQRRENLMNANLTDFIDSSMSSDVPDVDPATGGYMRLVNATSRPGFSQIHPVEPGRTVVAGPPAASPALILDLMKFKTSESAKIIGVPLDLTGNGGGHAVNVNIMHVFYNTIKQDRTILRLFYQVMFYVIHGDNLFGNASRDLLLESNYSEEVLAKVTSEHEFVVSFGATMDPLILDREYERNSFDAETYAKLTAAYHGIDVKQFDIKTLEKVRECKVKQIVSETERLAALAKAAQAHASAAEKALYSPASSSSSAASAAAAVSSPSPSSSKPRVPGANTNTTRLYNSQLQKRDKKAARYGAGLSSTSTSVQAQSSDPPVTSAHKTAES